MIKRLLLKILVKLIEGDKYESKDSMDNWVTYSYNNKGFDNYCAMRIMRLQASVTEKIRSRDEYIRDISAVEEINRMRLYVKAKYKNIENKKRLESK